MFAWNTWDTRGEQKGADLWQQGAQRGTLLARGLHLVPRFHADKFSFLGSALGG